MAVEPLTPEEEKEMADFALLIAMEKANTLSTVRALLLAAEQTIRGFQSCHNSYAGDPELEELRQSLVDFWVRVPQLPSRYAERVAHACGGAGPEAFDYASPNDERKMRLRDIGIEPDIDDDGDIPWVDPLEMYRQKVRR